MLPSDRYLKKLRRIRKSIDTYDAASFRDDVEAAFHSAMPSVPEELSEDLFGYFYIKTLGPDTSLRENLERLELLGYVVDLFYGDYDIRSDPLDEQDWQVVRDLVSSHAVDLDMDIVNYIMKLILEQGRL